MPERDWRVIVLAVMLVVALLSQLGPVLAMLFHEPQPPSFSGEASFGERFDALRRLGRFRAFQPGLYVLAVAAFARFAPRGTLRAVAGWFSLVAACAGFVSVIGQWYLQRTEPELFERFASFAVGRNLHHTATLVMIVAMAWWGWEALRTEPTVVVNDPT